MIRPILLIDWSVISYKCMGKMASANYEPDCKTEKAEFTKNIFEYLYYLKKRFNPHEFIFCVDAYPNWRSKYYKDYYIEKAAVLYNKETGEYIVEWDFKIHKFSYNDTQDVWLKKKLTIKELFELVIGKDTKQLEGLKKKDYDEYVRDLFHAGKIPGFKAITDLKKKEKIMYTDLYKHMPRYKKRNKEKNWEHDMPYTEFKKISTTLAFTAANTFGAKAICGEGAEADDVIAAYAVARAKTGRDVICVSVDTDLQQLLMKNQFYKFYNPNMLEGKGNQFGGFVGLDVKVMKYELYKKILSGDSSDTIYATFKKGTRKLLSEEQVINIMLTEDKPLKWAQKNIDRDILVRNTELVHLSKIPKPIFKNIISAIKTYKKPKATYTYKDFNVKKKNLLILDSIAEDHRKYDLSSGYL